MSSSNIGNEAPIHGASVDVSKLLKTPALKYVYTAMFFVAAAIAAVSGLLLAIGMGIHSAELDKLNFIEAEIWWVPGAHWVIVVFSFLISVGLIVTCSILAIVILNPMNKIGTPAIRTAMMQVFTVIMACGTGALFMCLMAYIMETERNSRIDCNSDRCSTFNSVYGLYVSSGVFNLLSGILAFITVLLSSFH